MKSIYHELLHHLHAQAEFLASKIGDGPLFEFLTINRSLTEEERKTKRDEPRPRAAAAKHLALQWSSSLTPAGWRLELMLSENRTVRMIRNHRKSVWLQRIECVVTTLAAWSRFAQAKTRSRVQRVGMDRDHKLHSVQSVCLAVHLPDRIRDHFRM